MVPKPISELMSIITSTDGGRRINQLFVEHIDEIFSHNKADITNHLVYLKNKEQSGLRSHLITIVVQHSTNKVKEQLLQYNIDPSTQTDDVTSWFYKRYNETHRCEDIFILGMSIVENNLHKDFRKMISAPHNKRQKGNTTE